MRILPAPLAVACLLAAATCASKPMSVRPVDEAVRFERDHRCALNSDELSERTRDYLRRNALDAEDLPALHARLLDARERALAFHLAEVAFLRGERTADAADAARCFLSAAAYAYAFLFDETLQPLPSPFDPIFQWSCDIYDRALAHVVAHAAEHRTGGHRISSLRALHAELDLERTRTELSWQPETYERVLVTAELEVRGVAGYAREHGLGVPVIALHEPPGVSEASDPHRFMPPMILAEAATVLARFGALPPFGGVQEASVEIYDPTRTRTVRIGGADVPLDADVTTPVAYMLDKAPSYSGFAAMRHGDSPEMHANLFVLQPYQPGRIPVVFVHGLMSAPMTWAPLFNEMLADPVLRERCQFWFFRYPTGYPVLYSAALLREALQTIARAYDPEGKDPAFQHMVLCSHSMGGLVSRLQVQTSAGRLWSAISDTPLAQLPLPQDEKELLLRGFEFERLPFVSRVVFMAVPHRGSELATGFIGWLGESMIDEPRRIDVLPEAVRPWLREPYRSLSPGELERLMTGIGNLSPENPVLREAATWPYPPEVAIHSIMGNEEGPEPGGTDGIVPYWSSHLDGVESEVVVESGHGVHWQMPAIAEVRRILRLHVEELSRSAQ